MSKVKSVYRSERVLSELFNAGGEIIFHTTLVPTVKIFAAIFALGSSFNKAECKRTLKRLEKNDLIKIEQKGEKTKISLRKKGREKAVQLSLESLEIKKPKKWDRKWRVVIFDIPNKHEQARKILRSTLRNLGFLMIQKSVYIHPFNCKEEIEYIRSEFQVDQYVKLLIVDDLEDAAAFRNNFGLK